MKTSLNEIKNGTYMLSTGHWEMLLSHLDKTEADDEPIEMSHILDALGLTATIRVLCAVKYRKDIAVAFAADCAEHVLHIFEDGCFNDDGPRLAIEAARNPDMSSKRLKAAYIRARNIVCTPRYITDEQVHAAYAAAYAASTAFEASIATLSPIATIHTSFLCINTAVQATDNRGAEHLWQTEHMRKILENEK